MEINIERWKMWENEGKKRENKRENKRTDKGETRKITR